MTEKTTTTANFTAMAEGITAAIAPFAKQATIFAQGITKAVSASLLKGAENRDAIQRLISAAVAASEARRADTAALPRTAMARRPYASRPGTARRLGLQRP